MKGCLMLTYKINYQSLFDEKKSILKIIEISGVTENVYQFIASITEKVLDMIMFLGTRQSLVNFEIIKNIKTQI